MKIIVISDLHGNLIPYPSSFWEGIEGCELLLICGDIVPLNIQFKKKESESWFLNEFKTWCDSLPVKQIYFIGGNHDYLLKVSKNIKQHFSDNVHYLKHELVEYKNYKIFGTPYCKIFGNWPFMKPNDELEILFNDIPENLDILMTHDPPSLGTVGTILQKSNINAGNEILSKYILERNPKYVFSGHIHSGNHNIELVNNSNIVNCSILDEYYNITYKPLIIEI